ncbi:MAG: transglutaminase-like domain-containing protein [Acidobacteriota bacterium]|nr:transglutaminase-like domain-containing protein [Acidobacteriota bacterium]
MTREEARARFAEAVARDENDLELDQAALLIAAEEYPGLKIEDYLDQLDRLAEVAKTDDDSGASPLVRMMRLRHLLFDEWRFRGNTENYHDARNSFLNKVIDRRTGIPITLSVVYLEVARRIGLKLFGVGMPGHFLVKYADNEREIFLDPFNGGRLLNEEQCREIIAEMYNGEMKFQLTSLQAVTKKQILIRMLQNLKVIYAHALDHHKMLGVIERILLITPDAITEIRDRGLVLFARARYSEARVDLEEYLHRRPMAEDVAEIEKRLSQLRQRQALLN